MIDHGMLNVQLAKRGCIDAQIDAYKAQKARNAQAEAKTLHEARQQARAAVVAMSDERCIAFSKGQMTAKQARAKLLSIARFTPALILSVRSEA